MNVFEKIKIKSSSEMAVGTNLLSGQASEWALLKRHESEDLFGVQLEGSFADTLTKTCQVINEHVKCDFVDLNCGCPIDLIFNKGGGCALMTRTDHFQRIVRSVCTVLDVNENFCRESFLFSILNRVYVIIIV